MPIAAGASNLFFNRDTKVFMGQSIGTPLIITAATLASDTLTTTIAHNLNSGDRVTLNTAGAAVLGGSAGVVGTLYYAVFVTATTFKLAATYAAAIAGTPVVTATGTVVANTTEFNAIDKTITPTTAVITGANLLTITATHNFAVGDVVSISGVTDAAYLNVNGVYQVSTITTTTAFTVALVGATNGTITSPGTIKIVGTNLWEIPVLAGYSASQSTTTSEITLAEMTSAAGVSRRGRQMFNTAIAPTEWSFDTYVRPYKASGDSKHYCVEEPLWANLIAKNGATQTAGTDGSTNTYNWALGVTRTTTSNIFDFDDSNTVTLGTFDLYYVLGANRVTGRSYTDNTDGGSTAIYKVSEAAINECSLAFDIEGISTVKWSGMGSALTELGTFDGSKAAYMGRDSTSNFIRNRLTAVTVVAATPTNTTYTLTLTGGQITINNNISYLTPEVLGVINKPLGHITGTRTISGNFSCYLDELTGGSIDLFQNIAEKGSNTVTNANAVNFYIGGQGGTPSVQVTIPQAHFEVPAINFDDVVSTEVNWHALPSTIAGTDEISQIVYKGNIL